MRGIGNIVVGVVFIIGGLSGKLVLIGTNSGELLAVVGVGLIVWGVIKMAKGGGSTTERPKMTAGKQAVVNQEAVVYSERDSLSPPITKLAGAAAASDYSAARTTGTRKQSGDCRRLRDQ
jgi:hypothetical protein